MSPVLDYIRSLSNFTSRITGTTEMADDDIEPLQASETDETVASIISRIDLNSDESASEVNELELETFTNGNQLNLNATDQNEDMQHEVVDEERSDDQEETREQICYEGPGQITNMHSDLNLPDGLVDGQYRFNIHKFANLSLFLHDRVWIKAIKSPGSVDWRILEMKLDKDARVLEIEAMQKFTLTRRKVKSVTPTQIWLEPLETAQGVASEVIRNTIAEVQLIPGDWLEVRTEETRDGGISSPYSLGKYTAKLLDRQEVKGKVTEVLWDGNTTYAAIDRSYYVPPYVWGSVDLQLGSPVQAVMFRSDQKHFSFRAATVREDTAALQRVEKRRVDALCCDKRGILINPGLCIDFGELKVGSKKDAYFNISNSSSYTHLLRSIKVQEDQTAAKFTVDIKPETDGIVAVFFPGELKVVDVKVTCEPLLIGQTTDFCIFDFGNFQIYKELRVKVLSTETALIENLVSKRVSSKLHRRLQSTEQRELERKQDLFAVSGREIVSAGVKQIRPAFFKANVERSKPYIIPESIEKAVKTRESKVLFDQFPTLEAAAEEIKYATVRKLTPENYQEMFHAALWMEELFHQTRRQVDNMENVVFRKSGESYFFEFPKLQDVYPKFHPNDPIEFVDEQDNKTYRANIARLGNSHIFVDLKEDVFTNYDNRPLSVKFKLGRTAYKRCHHAVDKVLENLKVDWLFPTQVTCLEPRIIFIEGSAEGDTNHEVEQESVALLFKKRAPRKKTRVGREIPRGGKRAPNVYPVSNEIVPVGLQEGDPESPAFLDMELKWANKTLNDEQKSAIRMILRGQGRPCPYIIFGPPGTGKTVTVVEAVIQIFRLDPNSRILVCGPSNASANQISMYLMEIGKLQPGEFIRFLGYSFSEAVIPELLKNYCMDGSEIQNVYLSRIIITTCNSAAQFVEAYGLVEDRFTHVFIDEAGYCHEPDSLIPISLVSKNNQPPQVVLAGDPNQLGPVLFDDNSAFYALSTSLLERLMENPLYKRDEDFKYPALLITKLIRNYRAHRDLLCLPSRLFYDNELIPASLENLGELSERLKFLPKLGVPLVFHGIRGEQSRDSGSPSWYNPTEVVQVIKYVNLLLQNGCIPDDIGIITPYRKQVEKIKEALLEVRCRPIRVGSVEEFQGGEKTIIILSLVRSMDIDDEYETLTRLSFAFSPKRFNVCLTRAKSLLIGIGNPHVFAEEYVWREFLKYAILRGVYIGCDLPLILQKYANSYAQGQNENNGDPLSTENAIREGGADVTGGESDLEEY